MKVPNWSSAFVEARHAIVLETAEVDVARKFMKTVTRNVSLSSVMVIEETNVYESLPVDNDTPACQNMTRCTTTARVSAGPRGMVMQRLLESFCLENFKQSTTKSREALHMVLATLSRPHVALTASL